MSQNDKLLRKQGLPILNSEQKLALRKEWQDKTLEDMRVSLKQYNKYVMLRPTGFGKTYTCARVANYYTKKGKVIFVYKSDILKRTFEHYSTGKKPVIKRPDQIIYETYASVGKNWGDKNYLEETLSIKDVSLIIFDECQFMGAETYRKALDYALTYLGHNVYTDDDTLINNPERSGYFIPYIGATATIERTDVDVCDKYFTYNNNGKLTYCWGENIFTLEDAFKSGLIIPPYYKYIRATDNNGKNIINKNRLTRDKLLKSMKIASANGDQLFIGKMKELQNCIIKNADKIVHDTILELYQCKNDIKNSEILLNTKSEKPAKLPEYMRFLVFAYNRNAMSQLKGNNEETFMGIVEETQAQFKNAFERYGYSIRTTIISSASKQETDNVNLIDPTPEELAKINAKLINEDDLGIAVTDQNNGALVIDLIFSINMLNVGYHVNNITGLVLRRWTGSNTIYYQQLGRCLSVDSDKIPVVFDFVDSIASAEITAPLFAVDKKNKAETTAADGTTDITYKGKKTHKPRVNETTVVNGKLVNPKWSTITNTDSIIVEAESADAMEILSRLDIFKTQYKAYSTFDLAYEIYKQSYESKNGIILKPNSMLNLYEAFRIALSEKFSEKVLNGLLTANSNALYDYIANKGYTLYIEYSLYNVYIRTKESGTVPSSTVAEYNSIFRMLNSRKEYGNPNLKFVVNNKDFDSFKQDANILELMSKYKLTRNNVLVYER